MPSLYKPYHYHWKTRTFAVPLACRWVGRSDTPNVWVRSFLCTHHLCFFFFGVFDIAAKCTTRCSHSLFCVHLVVSQRFQLLCLLLFIYIAVARLLLFLLLFFSRSIARPVSLSLSFFIGPLFFSIKYDSNNLIQIDLHCRFDCWADSLTVCASYHGHVSLFRPFRCIHIVCVCVCVHTRACDMKPYKTK